MHADNTYYYSRCYCYYCCSTAALCVRAVLFMMYVFLLETRLPPCRWRQAINDVDAEPLPHFHYVSNYVMGHGVQQKMDPDAMVRVRL